MGVLDAGALRWSRWKVNSPEPIAPVLLHPTATRVVQQQWAERVVSPYGSIGRAERHELMARDPYVFLHVTQTSAAGAERTSGSRAGARDEQAASRSQDALGRLLQIGAFGEVRPPGLYAYRLTYRGHRQTAIVGDVDLGGWARGRILPHERIQPQRTAAMADDLERLGVSVSPVALAYRDRPAVDALVRQVTDTAPLLSFCREDALDQQVWSVPEEVARQLCDALADVCTYIVDGHHRVSAALEVWRRRGSGESGGRLLGALFPAGELRVHAFHRVVADLAGRSPGAFLGLLRDVGFTATALADRADPGPSSAGQFAMYLDGRWYAIVDAGAGTAGVDAAVLQQRILGPVLEVDEAGADARLEYLPGVVDAEVLRRRVDATGGVAFALYPPSMSQIMAVVDAGGTFPPKSTYFDPKVRAGIFIRPV